MTRAIRLIPRRSNPLAFPSLFLALSKVGHRSFIPPEASRPERRLLVSLSEGDRSDQNSLSNPIIIGGGIAGLATAVALQNIANISSFTVLEKSTSASFFQDEGIGAGAQLGPNGLRALRAIGGDELLQKVMDSGSKLEGNAMVMPGGAEPMFMPDATGATSYDSLPQVFVRWSVLRKFLRDMIPEANIITDAGGDVAGYKVDDKDGSVTLVSQGGKAIRCPTGGLIVGADGAASTCRYWVQSGKDILESDVDIHNDLKDTGRVNIKAVVPQSLDEKSFKAGFTYAYFAANGGIGCFAGPAGEGHTYWAISIADEMSKDEAGGTKVTRFPANVDYRDLKGVKSALLSKLSSLNTSDCKFAMDLIEGTDPDTIYITRSMEATSIGPSLASRDGRVVLVGDAAHAMSGSYGQNPNFALEGAAELASCIRGHLGDASATLSALNKYSSRRVDRCIEMQKRSAERAEKAMRGEKNLEDVTQWIFRWDLNDEE